MNVVLLPVKVHLDGMIYDKVRRANWINLLWIATQFHHSITHSSKVHHSWNTTASTVLKGLESGVRVSWVTM